MKLKDRYNYKNLTPELIEQVIRQYKISPENMNKEAIEKRSAAVALYLSAQGKWWNKTARYIVRQLKPYIDNDPYILHF